MRATARDKVVTSGRLAGRADERRASPDPAATACPQPAYSLYSTDSEDQVTSLHRGLDQCAALLSGILQADQAASAGLQRTPKKAATKPATSTFQGKKTVKKFPTKTASPGLSRTMKGGAAKARGGSSQGKTASRKTTTKPGTSDLQSSERHRPAGAKLHPPRNPTSSLQLPSARHPTTLRLSASFPPSQNPSVSAPDAPQTRLGSACDGGEGFVPVRDGEGEKAGTRAEMVSYLLQELRALIAGQGSVAERLLSRLEQTVGGSDSQAAAISENPEFCRCVKSRHRKLGEAQEEDILLCSNEPILQKELATAQSSLQELQDDLTELRSALQDTQSQLRDTKAEKALMKTEWEAARNRLQESEREKSALASVAEQRLKEIENLKRLLQRRGSSDGQNSSVTQQGSDPGAASNGRIKEYLISLNQLEPSNRETVRLTAERDENPSESKGDRVPPRSIRPEQRDDPHPDPSVSDGVLACGGRLSHCDVESVWSSWSMRSESTFNTRDEAAFRDGLAALDASIASLQRTIQLDLKR